MGQDEKSAHLRDLSGVEINLHHPQGDLKPLLGFVPARQFEELPDDGKVIDKGLNVDLRLVWDQPELRLQGQLSGQVNLPCSRCLARFDAPLDVTIDRRFRAGRDPATFDSEVEMVEDTTFLEEGIFSLWRMVEEELLLALPMVPLCNKACAGLCVGCGVDLNQQVCNCQPDPPDGPFAALKGLKLN